MRSLRPAWFALALLLVLLAAVRLAAAADADPLQLPFKLNVGVEQANSPKETVNTI